MGNWGRSLALTIATASLAGCATLSAPGLGGESAEGLPDAPFQAPFTYDRWPAPFTPEALKAAEENAEAAPEDAKAQLALCDAKASRVAWYEAASSCRKAAELAPTVVGIHKRLVSIYWNLRAYDQARDAAAIASSQIPNDAATHYWLGFGHAKLGSDASAARELDEAIRLAPDRSDFYPEAIAAHQNLNDLGRAAALAATVARLAPGDDELVRLPAEVEKVISQRLLPFNAVVLEEPTNPAAYAYLGGGMARYGLHDRALTEFDNSLGKMPAVGSGGAAIEQLRAELHYNKGLSLLSVGRHDEALSEFSQSKTLRPQLAAQADFMTGLTYMDRSEPEAAIAPLEASVAAAPEVRDNRAALVKAYTEAGRSEEAAAAQVALDALSAEQNEASEKESAEGE